jgi:hypothetical protein
MGEPVAYLLLLIATAIVMRMPYEQGGVPGW